MTWRATSNDVASSICQALYGGYEARTKLGAALVSLLMESCIIKVPGRGAHSSTFRHN